VSVCVVYSEDNGYPPKTERQGLIYKCNKDTEINYRGNKMNSDIIAVLIAKVFLVTVFIMGMISLVTEIIQGTI